MLSQLFTNDVATIKRHIHNHTQGKGPMVVARIAGWPGTPQIYAVREEQALRQYQGLPLLPDPPKRLEVQLHPHGHQPWHRAQTLYLKSEETIE